MSKENIKSLGGSWVDSLYQKFEAVCQEVDDIVKHDHRKALENSVQLVGGNVIKFCSNVKDLIPSNAGAPLKDVEQSTILVESNSEVENGDKECSFVAITEQFSQQIDVTDSSKGWPCCSEVSDDVHFKNSLENPSFEDPCSSSSGLQLGKSESFSICQDRNLVSKEWKQPSEISDPRFTDRFLTDQNIDSLTEEKQPISDESELTYHVSSMTNKNFDLFTEKEEPLSGAPELTFPDEDPCESSMFQNQNGKLEEEESVDYLFAASIHSSGSEIHKKEKPLQENVDEQSSEPECSFIDGTVNDNIPENSPGPQIYVKEEMISDINHKVSQKSELEVEEENLPFPLTTSSATPIENETSTVRMTSTVTYPFLHFSDNTETNSQCTERHKDTEIGSVSTFAPASPTSELYACLISPKENVGAEDSSLFPFTSQEFTEVPINSPGESEGLKLKQMEVPGKSELDESCIFVQNDRNHVDLSAVGRRWTYKKKMRNPFTSRKKLEKEYKQLSLWYCDIDAEFNEVAGDKLVPSSHDDKHKHSSAQDLQDSEWELV